MSESLRNDGRIWVPEGQGRHPPAERDPRGRARLLPGAHLPVLRQPRPARHRLACREERLRRGPRRRAPADRASTWTSRTPSRGWASEKVAEKYGNLFEMYARITAEDPYEVPMRIYPAVHYTMGGLWVDYDLQTTIPGLFAIGEANFSDHGANRLGASRADAGPGRRLLRAAVHDQRLPGPPPAARRPRRRPSGRRRGVASRPRSACSGCWPSTATARPTPSTARSAS